MTASNPAALPGSHTVTVKITDDGGQTVTATNTVIVGGSTSGGAFVVGDHTAAITPSGYNAGTVTFWGAQWSRANALSGGPAPDAFEGFENSGASPQCGHSWTSDPGNSSGPPATIPSYIEVIVASSVTASGPTISGDEVHVVIVKTDAGYAADPGHPGTGTIVAVVC